jgi:hypothetical protein
MVVLGRLGDFFFTRRRTCSGGLDKYLPDLSHDWCSFLHRATKYVTRLDPSSSCYYQRRCICRREVLICTLQYISNLQ